MAKKSLTARLEELRQENLELIKQNGDLRRNVNFYERLSEIYKEDFNKLQFKLGPPAGLLTARQIKRRKSSTRPGHAKAGR
jgi:hypothetical protein